MPDDAFEELLGDFLLEARERLARAEEELLELEAGGGDAGARLEEIGRQLHTLKGNAGMMGFGEIQQRTHALEDLLSAVDPEAAEVAPLLESLDGIRRLLAELGTAEGGDRIEAEPTAEGAGAEASIRVPRATLERLSELMAELVTTRHELGETSAALGELDPRGPEAAGRHRALWRRLEESRLAQERLLRGVKSEILSLHVVPFRSLFGSLRRLARDESRRLGKRVRLLTRGEDTPIDRSLVELAGEVLGHLVRNSLVHGIEPPEVRRRRGKPETGSVLLSASVGSGTLEIEVVDDGDGVRLENLRAAAAVAGVSRAEKKGLHDLLFQPGLSTLAGADLAAGRGMGLSAVRDAVARYGGTLEAATVEGTGTRFGLRLPASASVSFALMVEVDGETYALPITSVVETVSPEALGGGRRLGRWGQWREKIIEVVDLGALFGTADGTGRRGAAVVVANEGRNAALLVDSLGDLREVVVKELADLPQRSPGIAGSTILGDGRVVMILDPRIVSARSAA